MVNNANNIDYKIIKQREAIRKLVLARYSHTIRQTDSGFENNINNLKNKQRKLLDDVKNIRQELNKTRRDYKLTKLDIKRKIREECKVEYSKDSNLKLLEKTVSIQKQME